jgi:hypothetical protein
VFGALKTVLKPIGFNIYEIKLLQDMRFCVSTHKTLVAHYNDHYPEININNNFFQFYGMEELIYRVL